MIGCGGQGEESLAAALGERLVAIVDVDDARLEAAGKKAAERGAKPGHERLPPEVRHDTRGD